MVRCTVPFVTALLAGLAMMPAVPAQSRSDALDDPLPEGVIARLGTTRMRHFHPPGRYCWGIGSIAWAPDGKTIATTTFENTTGVEARIWEASTGKARRPLENNLHYGPTFVRFSPDSKTLAAAAGDKIVLWDVATGKEVGQLAGRQGTVDSLVFCDGGKTLVSVSQDGTVHWWDVAGRKSVRSWQLLANEPRKNDKGKPILTGIGKSRFSADGKTLAVAQWWTTKPERPQGENRAIVYDLKARKEIWREDCDTFFSFAFAPDGKRLAKSRGGIVWLLETATGRELDHSDWYYPSGMNFSPDGKTLALVMNGYVAFWSPDEKTPVRKYDSPLHGGGYNTFSASPVFSPDGKQLAIDRRLMFQILDLATGKPAFSYPSYDDGLGSIIFSSDNRTLFASDGDILVDTATWRQRAKPKEAPLPENSDERSRSMDGTLCVADGGTFRDTLFDLKTGRAIVHFEVPDRQPADHRGFFSPRCSTYVMRDHRCDGKETVTLFAIPTGKRLFQLTFNKFTGTDCWSFSADEARVAFFERGNGIHVHDTATGKLIWKTGVDTASATLALSPSGDMLAAWSRDLRDVHVWNLAAKDQVLQILQRKAMSAAGCLAWSPDNRLLAVGSEDNSVRVWEIASGQVRREFLGHLAEPTCLAFSADGQILVSGSKDTTILVWKMHSDNKHPDSLTEDELAARWERLAAEAGPASEAMADLLHAPNSAVEFLAGRLQPAPAFDPRQVAGWIEDLDNDAFAVREKATRELSSLGDLVRDPLRKALAATPPAETRQRLQRLLDRMNQLQPAQLRCLRAIEVLERIGTPQAVAILERLTQGNPESRVTAESRTVLAKRKQKK